MKTLFLIGVLVLVLTASNSFAQMSTGQGGGMMGGGWGWGMNYGVFYHHYRDSRYFGYRLYDETKVKG